MSLIELKDVSVDYGKKDNKVRALDKINLTIDEGEFVAIIGKSGCGKTTLLNVLGKILDVESGNYYFQSQDVTKLSDKEAAKFRNLKIGFVVQHFALIRDMTVYQNIAIPLRYQKLSKKEIENRIDDLLDKLEIKDKKNNYPYQLSGGQCQRVAIARALATNPEVILADEPTGALDEENGKMILDLLKKCNERNIAVILVTHDLDLANEADRIIRIKDGKVCLD